MNDLISRRAAVDAICEDGTQRERQGQYSMTMVDRKYRDTEILEALPPAQPTLYGYDIKVLAFVASVMAKEGMSPEEAVTTFRDINRVIEIMLEDMRDGARRTLEQMFAGGQDGTV